MQQQNHQKGTERETATAAITLDVTGMTCASCSARLNKVLDKVPGVFAADVQITSNQAEISYDPDQLKPIDLIAAMEKTGFGVPSETIALQITGMTCSSCAARAEKVINKIPGVTSAQVNFADGRAEITAPQGAINTAQLISSIGAIGFQADLVADRPGPDGNDAADDRIAHRDRLRLIACALLTAPFLLQMGAMLGLPFPHLNPWVQFVLALSVQIIAGSVFYPPAWRALKAGAGNMDLLVALGTTAAFGLSCFHLIPGLSGGLVDPMELYFEASAMVLTLVLLGRYLEGRARLAVGQGLRGFANIRPDKARVQQGDDGKIIELRPDLVQPGDLVVVRAGERVPVDGQVVEGISTMDQSLVTGESQGVPVETGDLVLAGTLNGDGRLLIRTTQSGKGSTLERLITLVRGTQAAKPSVQKLVDRISLVFVPIVIGLSILTYSGWLAMGVGQEAAIIHAITVLIVACPCALGLATPTAIMAGVGRAAQTGILIRNLDALEQAKTLDYLVMDKTGTLTVGQPSLAKMHLMDGVEQSQILALAAALQSGSTHPLGQAMVEAAAKDDLALPKMRDVATIAGRGLGGVEVDTGRAVIAGNAALMRDRAKASFEASSTEKASEAFADQGLTLVYLAIKGSGDDDHIIQAIMGFSDQPRDGADQVIAAIRERGIKPIMLTGDSWSAAYAQAERLGLSKDEVIAEVLPEDKRDTVVDLQSKGSKVAMVGDGVNDAPALAQADLGIAMGSGTDVAMETADMTLMRPDLALILAAIDVTAATHRTILQNLAWAFLYNILALPLAVIGVLTPVVAGAAMAMSSVSVVGNAARLTRWRPKTVTKLERAAS